MLLSVNACRKYSYRLGDRSENNKKCESNLAQISRIQEEQTLISSSSCNSTVTAGVEEMGISSNCILKWVCSLRENKNSLRHVILFCVDEMTSQHPETSQTCSLVLNGELILVSQQEQVLSCASSIFLFCVLRKQRKAWHSSLQNLFSPDFQTCLGACIACFA